MLRENKYITVTYLNCKFVNLNEDKYLQYSTKNFDL